MNPELQRNLWLEAPPRRIAWVAIVLALVLGVVVVNADTAQERTSALGVTGAILFAVSALWAMRAATRSILSEIAERTWDFQRTSAISPWEMTVGKLAGATAPALGVGLVGLVVMALNALDVSAALLAASEGLGILTLAAALGLGAALIGVRKARPEGRAATLRAVFGGAIIGIVLIAAIGGGSTLLPGGSLSDRLGGALSGGQAATVGWWGATVPRDAFLLMSIWAFAGFAVAGAWRLMRLELQLQNAPIVWPAFVAFASLYTCGLAVGAMSADDENAATVVAGVAAVTSAALAYAAAFAEPADPVALRRFGGALARRGVAGLQLAPAALWPLAVAAVALLLTGLMGAEPLLAAALIAFLVRDLAVIAVFRLGPRPKRGDAGAIVALGLLYGVGAIIAAPLFVPTQDTAMVGLVSAAVQAAVFWAIAVRRIRSPEG